jgi:hypothetical protein
LQWTKLNWNKRPAKVIIIIIAFFFRSFARIIKIMIRHRRKSCSKEELHWTELNCFVLYFSLFLSFCVFSPLSHWSIKHNASYTSHTEIFFCLDHFFLFGSFFFGLHHFFVSIIIQQKIRIKGRREVTAVERPLFYFYYFIFINFHIVKYVHFVDKNKW